MVFFSAASKRASGWHYVGDIPTIGGAAVFGLFPLFVLVDYIYILLTGTGRPFVR
jgi:hypothetical protein